MIPIAQPMIGDEEKQALLEVLSSGQLAQGKWVKNFEEQFAAYIGTKYAVATSNGTTALHLALLACGIGEGDEVITTSFTFIASANTILYCGAKPVFVDVEEDTYNIDPKLIESKITNKTKAIMPVHLFGLPANMHEIIRIADKYDLKIIEDACQAHGAAIEGVKVGAFGDCGCFSFYPTKNMTTGEGGIITTNDPGIAEKARLLREHGMKVRYYHDMLGYNFRMTNIAAAIGIEQLKKLPEFNRRRQENAALLSERLHGVEHIVLPKTPDGYTHVFHQYTIRVLDGYIQKRVQGFSSIIKTGKSSHTNDRDEFINLMKEHDIGTGIYYPVPVHKQKLYEDLGYHDSLHVSEKLAKEVVSLPVHPGVKPEDI